MEIKIYASFNNYIYYIIIPHAYITKKKIKTINKSINTKQ